ncbi:hypothetical protein ACN38_g2222 [Penicillium nordicum]|uniref:Major facilitator superfamily (MFS) profile domain-containing protein n=1 Tax=Penicillium nordicum TaxID=229535 RepID=A0A0M9WJ32_9EURO|nr:hypothetical protein ACN38_g2222 [Penicillium nordicum]
MFVTNAGGQYILSTWYAPNEITQRTAIFFLGPALAGAFASLISAGALRLHLQGELSGWQWIFVIYGVSTIIPWFTWLRYLLCSTTCVSFCSRYTLRIQLENARRYGYDRMNITHYALLFTSIVRFKCHAGSDNTCLI